MKRCTGCGEEKPLEKYHCDKRAKGGRRARCSDCTADYYTGYYARNIDALLAYQEQYRAENGDYIRERDAGYRTANREKLRAWHREYRKTPGRRAAEALHTTVRRAHKRKTAVVPFTVEQLQAKCAYWNDCCWVCGDLATTIDHVKPLSQGGAHMLCNMRPACAECNYAKHDAWPLPSRAQILGLCG